MAENSGTASGKASNNISTGTAGNGTFTAAGGNDVAHARTGDDAVLAGDDTIESEEDDHSSFSASDAESGTMAFCVQSGGVTGSMSLTEIGRVVPGFTTGTLIETPSGPRPVESLRPGDLVLTLDDGPQPVRWVGKRKPGLAELMAHPSLQPVEIAADALGVGMPARMIRVSPLHRVLFWGAACELHFGTEEVLVPAIQLIGARKVCQRLRPVTYVQVMFDRHQIVQTHGLWSESEQPTPGALGGLPDARRDKPLGLFPDRAVSRSCPSARMTLNGYETQVLLLS